MDKKYQELQKKIDELFGVAARRELEINTIKEISKALSNTLERDKLLPKIMEEITRLIVHGILHLKGYNDKTGSEQQRMQEKENHYVHRYANLLVLELLNGGW